MIALAIAFTLGLATASDEGHSLWRNISRRIHNRLATVTRSFVAPPTSTEELPTLTINIAFASYTHLLDQRTRALQRGISVPDEQDYTPAEIWVQGTNVPVAMRLAGPVDHLGDDDKWGFEIRVEDAQPLLGMHHCYLLDPGGNNGLNEWAFVQALAHEDILAARYQFVRLIFNGDDRGIYALQEAPNAASLTAGRRSETSSNNQDQGRRSETSSNNQDQGHWSETPSNNQDQGRRSETSSNNQDQGRRSETSSDNQGPRPEQGIVVTFDTQTLRRSITHFQGDIEAAYADPVSNLSATAFQYLEIDPYRDAALIPDPNLASQREQALNNLRALQTGTRPASDIFDVDIYGRFLALVDLWGATQTTSLLNLHYYYNPISQALEPVSFNANALGSDARIDLALTYNDPAIQAAYVREAQRISQPQYLNQLQEALEPALESVQRQLEREYPSLDLPWAKLRHNQAQIQRSLNPVQPVSAYLGAPASAVSGTLRVEIGNGLNLPVEIVGFDIDGATFLTLDRQWVSPESEGLLLATPPTGGTPEAIVLRAVDPAPSPLVRYARVNIPLIEIHHRDQEIDFMHAPDIYVITRILGLTHTQRTHARPAYRDE
jgi:hypothetical protein